MLIRKRDYSLDYQPQNKAIKALLDCSNTIKARNYNLSVKDEELICPWIYLNNKPKTDPRKNIIYLKTNKNFNKTYHKARLRQTREPSTKTEAATPKNKAVQDEIQNYNYMSSNIINLSRELELIHNKKKNNYIRQQLYLRLKTS